MNNQQAITDLKVYKKIELNQEKNIQFFRDKHSTKEGTWGKLTVHEGTIEFAYLNGHGEKLSQQTVNPNLPTLIIPPGSWHKLIDTSAEFKATLQFCCQPHRYFEKKYHLAPIHQDLWTIHQNYLREREKMSVLDVGCGSGRNPLTFALTGHRVMGIDKNEEAIKQINHIATQEGLTNIETLIQDLNQPLNIDTKNFDFIYSTVALQFLNPGSVPLLLTKLQSLTSTAGMHYLVFPIKAEIYDYPQSFTYLPESEELYHFYQDSGWSILEYKERPGQLHKLDDNGKPKQGIFAHLLAQKHL